MNRKTFLLLPLFAAAQFAQAQTAPVSAQGAWMRPTVQGQTSTGAYMTLTATQPVTLVGASTPVAGTAEIHEMRMDGDVMRMRPVEALPIAPGKPVELKPGSYHVMLTQLKSQLQPASKVPMTLRFRTAGGETRELNLSVPVQATAPK